MSKLELNNRPLDATTIKYIAVVLMVIDHINEMFSGIANFPGWVDIFGRPVLTIFLFLAADSFLYTKQEKVHSQNVYC